MSMISAPRNCSELLLSASGIGGVTLQHWPGRCAALCTAPDCAVLCCAACSFRIWWWLTIGAAAVTGWLIPYMIAFLAGKDG